MSSLILKINLIIKEKISLPGLLHGQEIKKSGEKLIKMTKARKIEVKVGVFEKSQENFIKKIRFCQFKFTKFLIFKSL